MAKRPGRTVKLSVSIDRKDYELLKKRAKSVSNGNLSAALTDMIHIAREWEGRAALSTWLGEGRKEPSRAAMESIRAEWRGDQRNKRRTA